jgi:hypothetical protein
MSISDEDMTHSDITIDYKVSSFIYLYSDFWYNSLGSTCICHYLIVDSNMSQSASPSKLNYQFIGSLIVLYWKDHNSCIWSEIVVNEYLIETLFDKLSNISPASPPNHHDILSLFLPRATSSLWTCFSSLGPWPKW